MINVGIIGCGFVGGALKDWLEHNNPECKLFISDPAKGYHDDLSHVDIAFLQIHVPTEDDGTQDLTLMKELISTCQTYQFLLEPLFFQEPAISSLVRRSIRCAICQSFSLNVRLSRTSRGRLWCSLVRMNYSQRSLLARSLPS